MPPTKFLLQPTYHSGADVFLKILKMTALEAILDIGTEQSFAILNLCVAPMLPFRFKLNLTHGLGGDVV